MISSNQPKRPSLILDHRFNNHEHVAFDIYQLLSFSPIEKNECVIITNLNTPEHI